MLKANHGRALESVREHFERTCFGRGSGGRPVSDAFEGHGGSGKNLGRYAASWMACWPKRPSSTAALT